MCIVRNIGHTECDRLLSHRTWASCGMPLYAIQTYVIYRIWYCWRFRQLFSNRNTAIFPSTRSLCFRLPWSDDAPIGWFYGLLCSFWMSGTYFFINCIFISFFLSIKYNFDAFPRHFDITLSVMNEDNAKEKDFNQMTRAAILHAIDFHNLVKE